MPVSRDIGPASTDNPADSPVVEGTCYLLAIGIDQYKSPQVRPLYNAVRDAKKFITVLTSKYQFQRGNVTELFNEKATESAILSAIDQLIATVREEDSLIVYYSGHGYVHRVTNRGFWVPYEGIFGDASTAISDSTLVDHLSVFKGRHLVVIVDACFSGTLSEITRGGAALYNQEDAFNIRLSQLPSRWLLTSGRREPVLDGEPGYHSPFATHLLDTLKRNEEKFLSVRDLGDRTGRAVFESGYQQHPHSAAWDIGMPDNTGQFMFRITKDPGTALTGKDWEVNLPKIPSFVRRVPKNLWQVFAFIVFLWVSALGVYAVMHPPHASPGSFPFGDVPKDTSIRPVDTPSVVIPVAPTPLPSHKSTAGTSKPGQMVPPKGPDVQPVTVSNETGNAQPAPVSPLPPVLVAQEEISFRKVEKGEIGKTVFSVRVENIEKEWIALKSDKSDILEIPDAQMEVISNKETRITLQLATESLPVGPFETILTLTGSKSAKKEIKVTAHIVETTCPVYFFVVKDGSDVRFEINNRAFYGYAQDKNQKVSVQVPKRLLENLSRSVECISEDKRRRWELKCEGEYEF